MKTKTKVALVAVVLVAGLDALIAVLVTNVSPVPSQASVWIPENVIVLDSTRIAGSPKAYLFCYDLGAFGYSVKMVSLDKPTHHAPALVLTSEHVTGIRWRSRDTLDVVLDSLAYEMSRAPKGIVVIPVVRNARE